MDRSETWLRILDGVLRGPSAGLLGPKKIVKLVDDLEREHDRRFGRGGGESPKIEPGAKVGAEGLGLSADQIVAKWAKDPKDKSARVMCLKQVRRDLGLDLKGACAVLDRLWPEPEEPLF